MGRISCPPVAFLMGYPGASTRGVPRMSRPAERNARALTLLIVWSVALAVLFATLLALIPAARAGTCDQVGGVITGDWTITNTPARSGILYSDDGPINVNSGCSLTFTDRGRGSSKDT